MNSHFPFKNSLPSAENAIRLLFCASTRLCLFEQLCTCVCAHIDFPNSYSLKVHNSIDIQHMHAFTPIHAAPCHICLHFCASNVLILFEFHSPYTVKWYFQFKEMHLFFRLCHVYICQNAFIHSFTQCTRQTKFIGNLLPLDFSISILTRDKKMCVDVCLCYKFCKFSWHFYGMAINERITLNFIDFCPYSNLHCTLLYTIISQILVYCFEMIGA